MFLEVYGIKSTTWVLVTMLLLFFAYVQVSSFYSSSSVCLLWLFLVYFLRIIFSLKEKVLYMVKDDDEKNLEDFLMK